MTQEQKELLLKDLCARLPYKVKVQIKNVGKIYEICTLEEIDCSDEEMSVAVKHENGEMAGYDFDLAKPYLFPFSSMSEEQKKELSEIIDLEVEIAISHIKNGTPNLTTGITRLNWLLKNHFDIYDLIPMELANDATGKNIY